MYFKKKKKNKEGLLSRRYILTPYYTIYCCHLYNIINNKTLKSSILETRYNLTIKDRRGYLAM